MVALTTLFSSPKAEAYCPLWLRSLMRSAENPVQKYGQAQLFDFENSRAALLKYVKRLHSHGHVLHSKEAYGTARRLVEIAPPRFFEAHFARSAYGIEPDSDDLSLDFALNKILEQKQSIFADPEVRVFHPGVRFAGRWTKRIGLTAAAIFLFVQGQALFSNFGDGVFWIHLKAEAAREGIEQRSGSSGDRTRDLPFSHLMTDTYDHTFGRITGPQSVARSNVTYLASAIRSAEKTLRDAYLDGQYRIAINDLRFFYDLYFWYQEILDIIDESPELRNQINVDMNSKDRIDEIFKRYDADARVRSYFENNSGSSGWELSDEEAKALMSDPGINN
jgi:hypothetical protein